MRGGSRRGDGEAAAAGVPLLSPSLGIYREQHRKLLLQRGPGRSHDRKRISVSFKLTAKTALSTILDF